MGRRRSSSCCCITRHTQPVSACRLHAIPRCVFRRRQTLWPRPDRRWRISAATCPGEPDFFHGRGDGTDPEDLSKCYNCGFETHKFRSHCPKCGTTLQSRRWSRRFGLVLVICGLIICGLMGFVVILTAPSLLNTIGSSGGMGFSGTAGQARMVLAIFGGVLAFGLTALGYGHLADGHRPPQQTRHLLRGRTGRPTRAAGLCAVARRRRRDGNRRWFSLIDFLRRPA